MMDRIMEFIKNVYALFNWLRNWLEANVVQRNINLYTETDVWFLLERKQSCIHNGKKKKIYAFVFVVRRIFMKNIKTKVSGLECRDEKY